MNCVFFLLLYIVFVVVLVVFLVVYVVDDKKVLIKVDLVKGEVFYINGDNVCNIVVCVFCYGVVGNLIII